MPAHLPSGTEIARPFLPVKDYELSKHFYEALGFTKVFEAEVAIYQIGSTGFILQKYYNKEWAENFMMHLLVDDLDAWWDFITSLELQKKFGVPAPTAPVEQPWGLRVAFVIDPSGVLWHIAQNPATKRSK